MNLTLIGRGFWMLLEWGGGAPSRSPQNTVKNHDFLKVHNKTSRPLFSWRNGRLKKVRADSAPPPALKGVIKLPKNAKDPNQHPQNATTIAISIAATTFVVHPLHQHMINFWNP